MLCRSTLTVLLLLSVLGPPLFAAGSGAGSGRVFDIPRVEGIAIDGRGADWGERGFEIRMLRRVEGHRRGHGQLEPHPGQSIRLGWDERGLLVRLTLEDDRWVESAKNTWRYDSVEIYAAESVGSEQRYQVVIAPGMSDDLPEMRVNLRDRPKRKGAELKVEAARVRDGQKALLEVRLPWKNLGVAPERGTLTAFQLSINDNDEPGSGYDQTDHAVWYPAVGAAQDSQRMNTIRLAEQPSPPDRAYARWESIWSPSARAVIYAEPQAAGQSVTLWSGEGKILTKAELRRSEDVPVAVANLPLYETVDRDGGRLMLEDQLLSETPPLPSHPFLLCTADQFAQLKARAEREPWKSIRAAADAMVQKLGEAPLPPGRHAAYALNRYLGALTVQYLTAEPEQRPGLAQRIYEGITRLKDVAFDPSMTWDGTVPAMGAAFVAIVALDIVYNDLSSKQIESAGALIEQQIGKISPRGAWLAARLGTHGTWELFKNPSVGQTPAYRRNYVEPFYEHYLRQMTPEGVSTVSPIYAFSRLGSGDGRPQKTGFADVLEFTGVDKRYYDHPRLKRFYRFLFGYSVTPAKEYYMFGDVAPYWRPPNSALMRRVGRFDEQAAAYAAWLLEGKDPPGHVLAYVVAQSPLPEAKVPGSRLFMDGAAVLREPEDSPMSLGAMLYNIVGSPGWHAHEETNGLSLAGYGNRLLANGGWLGDSTQAAAMNNTLSINGRRHKRRFGAGLTEGLLAEGFAYACGHSGQALGDDAFDRSLLFVHGQDGVSGYFVTIDEVDADPGERVHSFWHPANESGLTPGLDSLEEGFAAPIDHHAQVPGVHLRIFQAPKPADATVDTVPSGLLERSPRSGRHTRITTVHPTDAQGGQRILTVFYPWQQTERRERPVRLARLKTPGFDGIRLDLPKGLIDTAGAADPDRQVVIDRMRLRAKAVLRRAHADQTVFWFVRHGRHFEADGSGFRSDRPVTLFMRGLGGRIASAAAAKLTLMHPDLAGVRLNGEDVKVELIEPGQATLTLPAGTHDLQLILDQ